MTGRYLANLLFFRFCHHLYSSRNCLRKLHNDYDYIGIQSSPGSQAILSSFGWTPRRCRDDGLHRTLLDTADTISVGLDRSGCVFVLSGFLITGILYDTQDDPKRLFKFYIRRTLRIFPLYYSIFLLILLATPIFHWIWKPGWFLWLVYLGNYGIPMKDRDSIALLTSGLSLTPALRLHFGHFWTLCVEEQFYLLWPLVVYLVKDRVRLRNVCLATVCIMPLLRLTARFTIPAALLHMDFLYTFTPFRIDSLLLGGFVALCLRGPEATRLKATAPWITTGLLALWVVAEGITHTVNHHFIANRYSSPWMTTIGFSLIDLFAAGVILLAIDPGTFIFSVLNLPLLRWLGGMSYGFYIFHQLFFDAYGRLTERIFGAVAPHLYPKRAVVAFCCTLFLAWLSFKFFESKFLKLKNRWAPNNLQKPGGASVR